MLLFNLFAVNTAHIRTRGTSISNLSRGENIRDESRHPQVVIKL